MALLSQTDGFFFFLHLLQGKQNSFLFHFIMSNIQFLRRTGALVLKLVIRQFPQIIIFGIDETTLLPKLIYSSTQRKLSYIKHWCLTNIDDTKHFKNSTV